MASRASTSTFRTLLLGNYAPRASGNSDIPYLQLFAHVMTLINFDEEEATRTLPLVTLIASSNLGLLNSPTLLFQFMPLFLTKFGDAELGSSFATRVLGAIPHRFTSKCWGSFGLNLLRFRHYWYPLALYYTTTGIASLIPNQFQIYVRSGTGSETHRSVAWNRYFIQSYNFTYSVTQIPQALRFFFKLAFLSPQAAFLHFIFKRDDETQHTSRLDAPTASHSAIPPLTAWDDRRDRTGHRAWCESGAVRAAAACLSTVSASAHRPPNRGASGLYGDIRHGHVYRRGSVGRLSRKKKFVNAHLCGPQHLLFQSAFARRAPARAELFELRACPLDRVPVPSADSVSRADEAWFRGERVRIVASGMQLHADMQTVRVSRCNGGNIDGDSMRTREDRTQDTKEQTKCEINLKQGVSQKGNSISIVIAKG
ncbi:hypothetical protein K438DRAFT_1780171 [Mycena galopus ATCC 62051]|nr:hypothetical protein K438DRAFT_1780171 [Mycena galopus ATCC 62051]